LLKASLVFLIIHPIGYPINCGGKGKAMKLNGKANGSFCYQLPAASFRSFRREMFGFLIPGIANLRVLIVITGNQKTGNQQLPTSNQQPEPLVLRMELSQDTKNILGLQLPTDPRWVNLAERSLEDILTDHAYCEQKAATSCISIIQRYNDKERIVDELSPIVTEEWGHFRLVLAELQSEI
jgi:hypothetical protein